MAKMVCSNTSKSQDFQRETLEKRQGENREEDSAVM